MVAAADALVTRASIAPGVQAGSGRPFWITQPEVLVRAAGAQTAVRMIGAGTATDSVGAVVGARAGAAMGGAVGSGGATIAGGTGVGGAAGGPAAGAQALRATIAAPNAPRPSFEQEKLTGRAKRSA